MSLAVDENVPVVPIFELEEVADDRVGCERLDEGVLRFSKGGSGGGAVRLQPAVSDARPKETVDKRTST